MKALTKIMGCKKLTYWRETEIPILRNSDFEDTAFLRVVKFASSDFFGVSCYDYGARYYDPNKSIFLGVDPLAEKYPNISSFASCSNNPIMLIDPDGRDAVTVSKIDNNNNSTTTLSSTIYITGKGASERKAESMNKYAAKKLKSNTLTNEDGTTSTINFKLKYKYVENADDVTLKKGDNMITGISKRQAKEDGLSRSKIMDDDLTYYEDGTRSYPAGQHAKMIGGINKNQCLHESLHLLGLSDRYNMNETMYFQGGAITGDNPHSGYENDIMGKPGMSNISESHYRNYMDYFKGKTGTDILRQRIDMDNKGNLKR